MISVPSNYNFLPTGIGSLPYKDPEKACRLILDYFPEIPFWPQLPKRSFYEGMCVQFSEGFPNRVIKETEKRIFIDTQTHLEQELTKFYDKFLSQDVAYFAISPDYAPCLHLMVKFIRETKPLSIRFIKGQVTGPITMGSALLDDKGDAIIYDPQLQDVLVKCLIMKAIWQIRLLKELGYPVIIFIDEPVLAGFGSAYFAIKREMIISQLKELIKAIHQESGLAGVHCCGNTDWGMLLETGLDILSFDAYGFINNLGLYPEALTNFLQRGGMLAWGLVPTDEDNLADVFTAAEPIKLLQERIKEGVSLWKRKGIEMGNSQSLLTPACGMGSLSEQDAEEIMKLLRKVYEGLLKR